MNTGIGDGQDATSGGPEDRQRGRASAQLDEFDARYDETEEFHAWAQRYAAWQLATKR